MTTELHDLLADTEEFVKRFVVFSHEHQPVAVTLWVAHTYSFLAARVTPYLAITAAEKESGKTRLLEVLKLITRQPKMVASMSVAYLFRVIGTHPTLLLDELDTLWNQKGDTPEAIRGILNAGFQPSATIGRVDQSMNTVDYPVYCPKAVAQIGDLPDTLESRSIDIRLQRRKKSEPVERLRLGRPPAEAGQLRERFEKMVDADLVSRLYEMEPELPESLSDRQMDCWEALVAIADLAGGSWPERARVAALHISKARESEESVGVRLLRDVRQVMGGRDMYTTDICAALNGLSEAGWQYWSEGKGINPWSLSRYLKEYGLETDNIRIPGHQMAQSRGLRWSAVQDAAERWVPDEVAGWGDLLDEVG